MAIEPTPEQLAQFQREAETNDEPVFMLNLLRFKEGGAEEYGRYSQLVLSHLERVGGSIVWAGSCHPGLIGPDDEWDAAAVVRYPSRAAFLEMVSDPQYLKDSEHRSAGLADSRLIPTTGAVIQG